MLEVANAVLAKDPANLGMMVLLADYYSEKGEQLDQADGSGGDRSRSYPGPEVIGDGLGYSELYTALQDAETVLRRKVSPIFLSE